MTEIETNKTASELQSAFFWLLALVFITLKLCGVIDWSWWWVLGPLWLPFAVVLGLALIFMIFASAWKWIRR